MSEKLTESITFKCTYEEKRELEGIARTEKKTLSEHMRSLGMANITEVRERIQDLAHLFGFTTDTVNTSFELTPLPKMIDVTPNTQAQKKPNCCDQLSLIAVHSDK